MTTGGVGGGSKELAPTSSHSSSDSTAGGSGSFRGCKYPCASEKIVWEITVDTHAQSQHEHEVYIRIQVKVAKDAPPRSDGVGKG